MPQELIPYYCFGPTDNDGISYDTVAQLKIDIDEYMDYYNNYRPHRTLGNKTPSQFEDEYHERLNARKS